MEPYKSILNPFYGFISYDFISFIFQLLYWVRDIYCSFLKMIFNKRYREAHSLKTFFVQNLLNYQTQYFKFLSVLMMALRGSVHFGRSAFFSFFLLDGKLLITSNIVKKNFLDRNLELLSSLFIIWFLSDRLFLLYKSSFEITLKKRAFAIEGV